MKRLVHILVFLASFNAYSQPDHSTIEWNDNISENLYENDYKDSLMNYDFGLLWTETNNSLVFGTIGENFQRIRIKIHSVIKSKNNPFVYIIQGKSMVNKNICEFQGVIKIINIGVYKIMHFGVDNEYENQGIKKQGLLIAEYHFEEDSLQTHSGIFEGTLYTTWYIDRQGKLKYDDLEIYSDIFRNNQFIGTWRDFKKNTRKSCNWGDYRVPNSGDLDIGAGEFSPDDKYLKNGWQTYRDAYFNNDKQALEIEKNEWWK